MRGWILVLATSMYGCAAQTSPDGDPSGGSANGTGGSSGGARDGGAATGGSHAGGSNTGGSTGTGGKTTGAGGSTGAGGTTTGTGGSTGTGGTPVVAGPCDALPAAGTWEKITPDGVNKPFALMVDPFDSSTVWLGTASTGWDTPAGKSGLFKSTDCGATWAHVSTGAQGSDVDRSAIWSMAIDPISRGTMYVVGAYGPLGLWKSTNGGVDWAQTTPTGGNVSQAVGGNGAWPPWIGSVSMDPGDPLHLVVGTHDNCTGPYAPACGAETTDGGQTWSIFTTPFLKGWAEQTGPYVIDANRWLYAAAVDGIWLTTDRGATWKDVTPAGVTGAAGGEFTTHPLRPRPDGSYLLPSYNKSGLIRSTDRGASWSLVAGTPPASYYLGFTFGDGKIYLGDYLNVATYAVASESSPTVWSTLAPPPGLPLPQSQAGVFQGAMYLDYDPAHHILYSCNFEAGVWRQVRQ